MGIQKKLTEEEAKRLLNMLKKSVEDSINFPGKSESIEFDVIGDTKKDDFAIKIYRGKVDNNKYEIGARIRKDGILLLELHVSPGKIHRNPNGEKITGSHWHIYTEEYGRRFAVSADDIKSENFVENTILFLDKFNVIEKPIIYAQSDFI